MTGKIDRSRTALAANVAHVASARCAVLAALATLATLPPAPAAAQTGSLAAASALGPAPLALAGVPVSPVTPVPAAPSPGALINRSPSPFLGSVPSGEASDQELSLSLGDVIERGLRCNLGLIGSDLDSRTAQAQRARALAVMLPQISGQVRHQTAEISLVQFGFTFPGVPILIGPFSYQEAGLGLTQDLFNLSALRTYQAAREAERAAQLSYGDARDTVVLVVGAAYYQLVASTARVETARAQLTGSQALEELAQNQVRSGLAPMIDQLRSTVQRRTDEQRLAVGEAQLAKDKLSLARLIGLPLGQRFTTTTPAAYLPWSGPNQEAALLAAYGARGDLKSAEAALRSAELARRAAAAQRLPTLGVNADYDRVGKTLGTTDGIYTLAAGISVPVFNGGRISAAIAQADAVLARRKAEYADFKARVDYEVRSAFLDLQAADTSVLVARDTADLARRTVEQARDRFSNGVTNNLEVVLAEEQVVAANENYTASLFAHNFAKLSLLRAMGLAEQGVRQYLSSAAPAGPR
jgi:outer membrane protein TolC